MSEQKKKFPEIIQFFIGLAKPFIEKGIENFVENGGIPFRKKTTASIKALEAAQRKNAEASQLLAETTQKSIEEIWAHIKEQESNKA